MPRLDEPEQPSARATRQATISHPPGWAGIDFIGLLRREPDEWFDITIRAGGDGQTPVRRAVKKWVPAIYWRAYHPYHRGCNPDFDEWSQRILSLKHHRNKAFAYFEDNLRYALEPLLRTLNPAIAVVPPHDPVHTSSGVRVLAQRFPRSGGTDATNCLVRHTAIERLSGGGDRSINVHFNSIAVTDLGLICGQTVLLLDDISTTGNSFRACAELLFHRGAQRVLCLALGRTVR